jgi:hypothetical protein
MPPFANPPTSGRPREVRARRVDGVDGAVERPDVHRVPDHRRWGLTLRGQVDPPVASPVVLVERVQFAALGDGVDDAGLVREGRENLAEKVARPLDRAGRGVQTAHVPVAADEHRLAVHVERRRHVRADVDRRRPPSLAVGHADRVHTLVAVGEVDRVARDGGRGPEVPLPLLGVDDPPPVAALDVERPERLPRQVEAPVGDDWLCGPDPAVDTVRTGDATDRRRAGDVVRVRAVVAGGRPAAPVAGDVGGRVVSVAGTGTARDGAQGRDAAGGEEPPSGSRGGHRPPQLSRPRSNLFSPARSRGLSSMPRPGRRVT